MSSLRSCAPTVAATPESRHFAGDLDVLEELRALHPDIAVPAVRFADDVSDFSQVPGRPAYLSTSELITDFMTIPDPWLRLAVKELLAAMLCPCHPEVQTVATRRHTPFPVGHVRARFHELRAFFEWMCAQGIVSLSDVRQEHCDAYLLCARERGVSPLPLRGLVRVLRDLDSYRPALTETYEPGFRPWKFRNMSRIVPLAQDPSQNRTSWIPEDVFDAVLAGALFVVQTVASDIIRVHHEVLRLTRAKLTRVGPGTAEARLARFLDGYVRSGRPLPRRRDGVGVAPRAERDDPLRELNFELLGNLSGVALRRAEMTDGRRAMLEAAVAAVGLIDGGLDTQPREVLRADGTRGPWRGPFDQKSVPADTRLLMAACFVVIAALSGMRESEVAELRRGCVERVDAGDGQVRYRLRSRVIKRRQHGGDDETWSVVEPVVQAVDALDALAEADAPADARLIHTGLLRGRPDGEHPAVGDWMAELCDWLNENWERRGLRPVPTVDGVPWRLNGRQLRRTLARQLAFRPHGTIASKVHLKHVSATVTEGYFGPAGESAAAFLEEVEAEQRQARLETLVRQYEEWAVGAPVAGGASKHLIDDFKVIEREMSEFQGTVEQSDRRLRLLLRRRAGTLHVGMLHDCHFTDPSRSRCLQAAGVEDADAPIIAACAPDRCPNAVITRDHLSRWRVPLAQIENLLTDRKVPPLERERLRAEQRRIENIIAPLEENQQP